MIIRSSLGLSFGVILSVLLFKRRAWPVWLGTGFGAGRAWEEADGMRLILVASVDIMADMKPASFRRGDSPVRDALYGR